MEKSENNSPPPYREEIELFLKSKYVKSDIIRLRKTQFVVGEAITAIAGALRCKLQFTQFHILV